MWATIGKLALQFGMWCFKNPDKVELGVTAAHDVIDAIHAAKQNNAKS